MSYSDKNYVRQVASNKKAYHDYFIEYTYEAGIALEGSEVKSVRAGRINLKDSYVQIKDGTVWLYGCHISPYDKGSAFSKTDPDRRRRLLLNRAEIGKLRGRVEQKGYTIVPTKVYFKQALVKVEIALAKGKELHDKRRAIADKENKRSLDRAIKTYQNK